jgi:putative phosphoesterase
MKIGVISDTHNFLDPKVPELLAGVDHILHGGDIGQNRLILELEAIAPVTAVLGNTDDAGLPFKQTEVVELAGQKFLVHHIINPRSLEESIAGRIEREKPSVVVFGHTHKPFNETLNGTLYFNPGYAGNSRFGMERSVAILHWNGKKFRPEYLRL